MGDQGAPPAAPRGRSGRTTFASGAPAPSPRPGSSWTRRSASGRASSASSSGSGGACAPTPPSAACASWETSPSTLPRTARTSGAVPSSSSWTTTSGPREIAGVPPDGFSDIGQLWGKPALHLGPHEGRGVTPGGASASPSSSSSTTSCASTTSAASTRTSPSPRAPRRRRAAGGARAPASSSSAPGGARGPLRHRGRGPGIPHSLRLPAAGGLGLSGMRVLEFAFDTRDGTGSAYLPYRYPTNCVATSARTTTTPRSDGSRPRPRRTPPSRASTSTWTPPRARAGA